MNQPPICSYHKTPMTWKEGIGKQTGKPYAFWACSQKNSDGSFCKAQPIMQEVPVPAQVELPQGSGTKEATGSDDVLWAIVETLREIRDVLRPRKEVGQEVPPDYPF